MSEALRFNSDKPMMSYFMRSFPKMAEAVARVKEMGAIKYNDGNWRLGNKPDDEYWNSMFRHLDYIFGGEFYDSDTGCLHIAHAVWNLCALLELNYPDLPARDDAIWAERAKHWAEEKKKRETKEKRPKTMTFVARRGCKQAERVDDEEWPRDKEAIKAAAAAKEVNSFREGTLVSDDQPPLGWDDLDASTRAKIIASVQNAVDWTKTSGRREAPIDPLQDYYDAVNYATFMCGLDTEGLQKGTTSKEACKSEFQGSLERFVAAMEKMSRALDAVYVECPVCGRRFRNTKERKQGIECRCGEIFNVPIGPEFVEAPVVNPQRAEFVDIYDYPQPLFYFLRSPRSQALDELLDKYFMPNAGCVNFRGPHEGSFAAEFIWTPDEKWLDEQLFGRD
jgi:hypothetical protein